MKTSNVVDRTTGGDQSWPELSVKDSRVQGVGIFIFEGSGLRVKDKGLGFRISDLGSRGFAMSVYDRGFRSQGSGFRV
jgi:hypothetical protein